jgi:hypothetical protein
MNKSELTFAVQSTGPNLRLIVKLDDNIIYDKSPGEILEKISYQFDDDTDRNHLLCFEMSGKLSEHTIVTESGEILDDITIKITDVAFDDIKLGQIFVESAEYYHDRNGTDDPTIDKFYGVMGCNGRVEMRFSTPIYLWLLENI